MSLFSKIANLFRGQRVNQEIDEELRSHIEEAIAQGRDPAEARQAFGSSLRHREESRDIRLLPWLESLRADIVFGWRQLNKNKVVSAAAILSLALAIGGCTSAFRLIDALLLRPLPIESPEQLYIISYNAFDGRGQPLTYDSGSYPLFRQMREAVKGQAELFAISFSWRRDITYGSDQEMEKAYRQRVSGEAFSVLGLRPALGRLLTKNDDLIPGAHPYAVLSHDYWTRRFDQDPNITGRTFRYNDTLYEIVGVAEEPFTGLEPGVVTDIFIPTMMAGQVENPEWSGQRMFLRLKPGVAVQPIQDKLYETWLAFTEKRLKAFPTTSNSWLEQFFRATTLSLKPAATGASELQQDYRLPLTILGVLVALVLLIACANVANLMSARGAARARDMALRVSIGAGRLRLVQLVLIESALLALLAAAVGASFAWRSAPLVIDMLTPRDNPVRLSLETDWRVLGFGLALALGVTILSGLAPALRASTVKPASALKGGEDPHSRRRLMRGLVAAQVAFCFVVLFVAGLFVATFERLTSLPTGFSADGVLALDAVANPAQPAAAWDEVARQLRSTPGVETVVLAGWPLLSGETTNASIAVNGGPGDEEILTEFLCISPGWIDAMKIPLLAGEDFRPSDTYPGVAIVNEAFAKLYFGSENPIGQSFERVELDGQRISFRMVGLVGNVRYRGLRDPVPPTAYVPCRRTDAEGAPQPRGFGTLIVRTSIPDSLALASILRQEVSRVRSEFRVSNIRTQQEINDQHTIRERLLATLALFFALTALLLAAVGLFGVLDYSVLQRRREISIRMALGAQAGAIVRAVTLETFAAVALGAVAGLALGLGLQRSIQTLLYEVQATDLGMFMLPSATIVAAALLAAIPPVLRAVRLNPAETLRPE